MKMRFIALSCLCAVFFSLFAGYSVYGKDKLVEYLPQNESMDMVSRNPGVTVNESDCPALDAINKKLKDCQDCVTWAGQCPACCLDTDKWVIRCTPDDNVKYQCTAAAFLADSCKQVDCGQFQPDCTGNPDAIPYCQKKGCPDPTVDGKLNKNGYYDSNNLPPKFTGCDTTNPDVAALLKTCSPYYNVTPVYSKPPGSQFLGYSYAVMKNFSDCIDACQNYADAYEQCIYGKYCCKKNLCDKQGYDKACAQPSCDSLVANPKCKDYYSSGCSDLLGRQVSCLTAGVNGECYNCFKEIPASASKEPLAYRFVARSREKIVVAWQVTATPVNAGDGNTYFYTQVKVLDEITGAPVQESFVTQKSLIGSFTIFSATAIDKNNKEEYILEPGHAYIIKPYYYLPNVGLGLSVRIDQVQLIIMRTRE